VVGGPVQWRHGFLDQPWDAWSPSFTWADVQVGDLNGDGKADLLGRALENGQWVGGPVQRQRLLDQPVG